MGERPPLVPPGTVWSHSPDPTRDEQSAYRLPKNEVLPFLAGQTSFLEQTSSPANDEARAVIYGQQYPRLHGPVEPRDDATGSAQDLLAGSIHV